MSTTSAARRDPLGPVPDPGPTETSEGAEGAIGTAVRSDHLRALGWLGIAGPALFALVLIAMHVIQSDLTPHDHFMSEYALGDLGFLVKVGFLVLAAGVGALTLGLRRSLASGRSRTVGVALMTAATAGFAASGVVDTDSLDALEAGADPTWHGILHDLSGFVAFLGTIVGAFVLRSAFGHDARWRPLRSLTLLYAAVMAVLLGILLATPASAVGIAQRPLVMAMLLWFMVLGAWLRWLASDVSGAVSADEPAANQVTAPSAAVRRSAAPLAVVALIGPIYFATAIAVLGATDDRLSLASNWVSNYVTGEWGPALNLGFVLAGVTHIALGVALRRTVRPSKRLTFVSWALGIVGVGTIAGGLFPSRLWSTWPTGDVAASVPEWHQAVHDLTGLLALPLILTYLFMLRGIFARDPRWRPFARIQLVYAVVFVVVLVAFMASPEWMLGVSQRVHQTVIFLWLASLSLWTLGVARSAADESH